MPRSFGGDSNRLYLTSHSSGSHLGGCVVTHDWRKENLPLDILKGATLGSGMYDLKPVRLSKRSKYVKFTDEMEEALEPAAAHRQAATRPSYSPMGLTRRRNSSGKRAISTRR